MSIGSSGSSFSNRVDILVNNQVENEERLRDLHRQYSAIKDEIDFLNKAMNSSAGASKEQVARFDELGNRLEEVNKRIVDTKENLRQIDVQFDNLAKSGDVAGRKLSDMAQLGRAASFAFQDLAQGGLSATINNMDQMGTSIGRILSIGANLGPWLQVIATTAYLVTENWSTLARLFERTPDSGFIDRIHLSKEAMKDLEKQAQTSIEKFTELRRVKEELAREEAERKGGVIEPMPTETERAAGGAMREFIGRELKGSMGPLFDNLNLFLRQTREFQDSAEGRALSRAIARQQEAKGRYEEAEAAGKFDREGGEIARSAMRTAIDAAGERVNAAQMKSIEAIDRLREAMFGQISRFGAAAPQYGLLERFLTQAGATEELARLRMAGQTGEYEAARRTPEAQLRQRQREEMFRDLQSQERAGEALVRRLQTIGLQQQGQRERAAERLQESLEKGVRWREAKDERQDAKDRREKEQDEERIRRLIEHSPIAGQAVAHWAMYGGYSKAQDQMVANQIRAAQAQAMAGKVSREDFAKIMQRSPFQYYDVAQRTGQEAYAGMVAAGMNQQQAMWGTQNAMSRQIVGAIGQALQNMKREERNQQAIKAQLGVVGQGMAHQTTRRGKMPP